jgi:hypothetical protein
MKKGVLVLMVLFVIGFMGCDNGTGSQITKFEGTWKHITTQVDFRYIFTNNNFTAIENGNTRRVGTFTFTDTTITFTTSQQGTWTQSYTLSGDEWTLANDGSHDQGKFIKQP